MRLLSLVTGVGSKSVDSLFHVDDKKNMRTCYVVARKLFIYDFRRGYLKRDQCVHTPLGTVFILFYPLACVVMKILVSSLQLTYCPPSPYQHLALPHTKQRQQNSLTSSRIHTPTPPHTTHANKPHYSNLYNIKYNDLY